MVIRTHNSIYPAAFRKNLCQLIRNCTVIAAGINPGDFKSRIGDRLFKTCNTFINRHRIQTVNNHQRTTVRFSCSQVFAAEFSRIIIIKSYKCRSQICFCHTDIQIHDRNIRLAESLQSRRYPGRIHRAEENCFYSFVYHFCYLTVLKICIPPRVLDQHTASFFVSSCCDRFLEHLIERIRQIRSAEPVKVTARLIFLFFRFFYYSVILRSTYVLFTS